ncbi:MAG: DUF2239 family protein, partial [Bacteroidota bacterium]
MEATYTSFGGQRCIASGTIEEVALKTKEWLDQGGESVLIFHDQTGTQFDLDLRGTPEEAIARLSEHPLLKAQSEKEAKRTGPGRPKLGVVSREISLLPRHWDWLNEQPGGASVTIRKLVEETMKSSATQARVAREAASRFMWAMAGNCPHFEEASRAFSRQEYERFEELIGEWPKDIRDHVKKLVTVARE